MSGENVMKHASTIPAAAGQRNPRIELQMMLAIFDVAAKVPLRISGDFFFSLAERARRVRL